MTGFIALAGLMLLAAGCAQTPINPESLTGKDFAIVQSEHTAAFIASVDGGGAGFGRRSKAVLKPGKHVLTVVYYPGTLQVSTYVFQLSAEAGHVYRIKHKVFAYNSNPAIPPPARVWIVDAESGKEVGRILESRNEPVTEDTPPFAQSMFTWSAPPREKWVVLSRSDAVLAAARDGENPDESHVVAITVYRLPPIETLDEFVAYVKKGRSRPEPNAERFENLVETVLPFTKRSDFCVRYRHVARDKQPTTRHSGDPLVAFRKLIGTQTSAIMLMENDGYSCRIPGDKSLGINFEYSRRYHEGSKQDGIMAERADALFEQLKF